MFTAGPQKDAKDSKTGVAQNIKKGTERAGVKWIGNGRARARSLSNLSLLRSRSRGRRKLLENLRRGKEEDDEEENKDNEEDEDEEEEEEEEPDAVAAFTGKEPELELHKMIIAQPGFLRMNATVVETVLERLAAKPTELILWTSLQALLEKIVNIDDLKPVFQKLAPSILKICNPLTSRNSTTLLSFIHPGALALLELYYNWKITPALPGKEIVKLVVKDLSAQINQNTKQTEQQRKIFVDTNLAVLQKQCDLLNAILRMDLPKEFSPSDWKLIVVLLLKLFALISPNPPNNVPQLDFYWVLADSVFRILAAFDLPNFLQTTSSTELKYFLSHIWNVGIWSQIAHPEEGNRLMESVWAIWHVHFQHKSTTLSKNDNKIELSLQAQEQDICDQLYATICVQNKENLFDKDSYVDLHCLDLLNALSDEQIVNFRYSKQTNHNVTLLHVCIARFLRANQKGYFYAQFLSRFQNLFLNQSVGPALWTTVVALKVLTLITDFPKILLDGEENDDSGFSILSALLNCMTVILTCVPKPVVQKLSMEKTDSVDLIGKRVYELALTCSNPHSNPAFLASRKAYCDAYKAFALLHGFLSSSASSSSASSPFSPPPGSSSSSSSSPAAASFSASLSSPSSSLAAALVQAAQSSGARPSTMADG